jgi:dTMP kinase
MMYAADRAEHVEAVIRPALARGTIVVTDRYVDSSLAYQGGGRELGIDPIRAINDFATGGRRPDRTLLLELEPGIGRSRARARGEPVDRLEGEDDDFFARVAAAYRQLAEAEPERVRTIDAGGPPEKVLEAALAELEGLA